MVPDKTVRIYSASAIRGDTKYARSLSLPRLLKKLSIPGVRLEVKSEQTLPEEYDVFAAEKNPYLVFERDVGWLKTADAVIAEISGQSTGTGWEVCLAQITLGTPVLCLAKKSVTIPTTIAGNTHKNLFIARYSRPIEISRIARSFIELLILGRNSQRTSHLPDTDFLSAAGKLSKCRAVPGREKYFIAKTKEWNERYLFVGLSATDDDNQNRLSEMLCEQSRNLYEPSVEIEQIYLDELTYRESFKYVTELIGGCSGAIFDISGASTDLGWQVCFAQARRKLIACTYKSSSRASFMVLGNARAYDAISLDSLSSGYRRSFEDIKMKEEYDHVEEWKEIAAGFIKRFDVAVRRGLTDEGMKDYFQAFISYNGEWSGLIERRARCRLDIMSLDSLYLFFAKSSILYDKWKRLTRSGLVGNFLSGERARLIASLPRHDGVWKPSDIYRREKYFVGYSEKALAKNIRGMKDIGLLESIQKRQALTPRARQAPRARVPPSDTRESAPSRILIHEQIILTDYAYVLSDFLKVYGSSALESLFNKISDSDMGLHTLDNAHIDDDGHILKLLSKNQRLRKTLIEHALAFQEEEFERTL